MATSIRVLPSFVGSSRHDPVMGEANIEVGDILEMEGQQQECELDQGGRYDWEVFDLALRFDFIIDFSIPLSASSFELRRVSRAKTRENLNVKLEV